MDRRITFQSSPFPLSVIFISLKTIFCGIWKSLPSPWLKAWPQLFNISMKPVKGSRYVKWPCQRLAAQLLLYKTAQNGLAPCVPSSSSGLWGWGHLIYIFLVFSGHLEFWTPLQIPILGPLLATGCPHYTSKGPRERLPHIGISLPLFLLPFPSD